MILPYRVIVVFCNMPKKHKYYKYYKTQIKFNIEIFKSEKRKFGKTGFKSRCAHNLNIQMISVGKRIEGKR